MKVRIFLFLVFFSFLLFKGLTGCGGSGNVSGSGGEIVYENVSLSGTITASQTWRGIIYITGDVTIEAGATVTIAPGTQVRFAAGADDQRGGSTTPITDPPFPNDPAIAPSQISSISVFGGTLRAVGTATEPIVFTSSSATPAWGDWESIQYNKAGSKLVLQYTVIEYGYSGVQIDTAADNSGVTLTHNTIRNVVACGICGSTTDIVTLTLSANDISYCGHEGIAIFSPTSFTIEDSVFHDNIQSYGDGPASVAVNVGGDTVVIRNNQFSQNWIAINVMSATAQPTISGNTFTSNTTDCNGYCP